MIIKVKFFHPILRSKIYKFQILPATVTLLFQRSVNIGSEAFENVVEALISSLYRIILIIGSN